MPAQVDAYLPIAITGLTRRFGTIDALSDLTLSVATGEMVAVVGPDGAGKSTLMRTLAGVLPPHGGDVSVLGWRLPGNKSRVDRRVGYLAQGFSLYGDLTVEENLSFFARIYRRRASHDRREELLAFTRLAPFRRRLAAQLSGGMKKKLALACALVHEPELILLDEPTTGVDPVTRRDFWVLLGRLRAQGLSVLVATPYLDEAERCDRVALLDGGRLLAMGTAEELKMRVPGVFFEIVTSQPREARACLTAEDARVPVVPDEVQAQGNRIYVRFDTVEEVGGVDADVEHAAGTVREDTLRALLAEHAVHVDHVRSVRPTLENVYLSLMARNRGRS